MYNCSSYRKYIFLRPLSTLFFFLAGLTSKVEMSDATSKQVIEANTRFAASLFKALSTGNADNNIFVSPFSLSSVLSMTLVGAREKTESEITNVLGLETVDKENLHSSYQNILQSLAGTVNIANRIFVQERFDTIPTFMEALEKNYNSGCTNLNFGSPAAENVINEWVRKETNEKIQKLVESLDSDTVMIIANAIYFKSLWEKQFRPSRTEVSQFYINDKETVNVNLMYQSEKFRLAYHEGANASVLELPHNNNKTSMLIFLPRENDGLAQLESKFGVELLEEVLAKMSVVKTNVWLPAFKLEENYALKNVFLRMGMTDLFDSSNANLSGISKTQLYASEVIHKSFIEVNEEGTEAAAASGVILMKRSLEFAPDFRANHPFLFCIIEKESKHILFLGRLARPKEVEAPIHEEL